MFKYCSLQSIDDLTKILIDEINNHSNEWKTKDIGGIIARHFKTSMQRGCNLLSEEITETRIDLEHREIQIINEAMNSSFSLLIKEIKKNGLHVNKEEIGTLLNKVAEKFNQFSPD